MMSKWSTQKNYVDIFEIEFDEDEIIDLMKKRAIEITNDSLDELDQYAAWNMSVEAEILNDAQITQFVAKVRFTYDEQED